MTFESLQTLAPFVPTGLTIVMLLLTIRKMGEELYIPRIAPVIVIAVTVLVTFAYAVLTRTQINWLVGSALIAGGFVLGGIEGQMTRLYYRGPIIVGKRSVGYMVFWGIAYVLTMALTATGDPTLHAAGVQTLMFGLGLAVGDNTTLLFRQLFLKRPPPAAAPDARLLTSPGPVAAPISGDPAAERFSSVESRYFLLRGQLEAGRITRAQLEAALKEMIFQDAQGRWWSLGLDSARWYVRHGDTWVESVPPGVQTGPARPVVAAPEPAPGTGTPVPVAAPVQSNGCSNCGCLMMGALVMVLLLSFTLLAGYWLLRTTG